MKQLSAPNFTAQLLDRGREASSVGRSHHFAAVYALFGGTLHPEVAALPEDVLARARKFVAGGPYFAPAPEARPAFAERVG